jgi:5-hydroxyisourate hydrolase-like protein (transthyretin family)
MDNPLRISLLSKMVLTALMVLAPVVRSQATAIFTGVVLDSASGKPVAGATVDAGPVSIMWLKHAITDDSGRFSISLDTAQRPGEYLLGFDVKIIAHTYFTKDTAITFSTSDSITNATIFITQHAVGSIGGTVTVQGTGSAVIGAKVDLLIGDSTWNSGMELTPPHWEYNYVDDSMETDSGGHFRFDNVVVDNPAYTAYGISVTAAGYLFNPASMYCPPGSGFNCPLHPEKNKLLVANFELIDTSISGRIFGRVAPSIVATVVLTSSESALSPQQVQTGVNGYYLLWSLPRANSTVTASSAGYYTKSQSGISIAARTIDTCDFFLIAKPAQLTLVRYTPNPTNDKTPTLCWNGVGGASGYKIQIDNSSSFSNPVVSQTTGDSVCFTVKIDLPVGQYYWHVSSNLDFAFYSNTDSFTITDGPIGILLSNSSIENRVQTGSIVGLLTTVGLQPASEYHYSLVAGYGDADNSRFLIRSDTLVTAFTADSASPTFFHIRIRTIDNQSRYFEESFIISIGQNIAFHKPATASGSYQANTPDKAVDGDTLNGWGVDHFAGAWIKIDFQGTYTIRNFKMKINQTPAGNTIFNVFGYAGTGDSSIIHTFSGYTVKDQWLACDFATPLSGQTAIKVYAQQTPSWVAIYEIMVMGFPDTNTTSVLKKIQPKTLEFSVHINSFSVRRSMAIVLPNDSRVRIVNSAGRIMQDFGLLSQGRHTLAFTNLSIVHGCYFLEVKMPEKCVVKRIMLLR